MEPLQAAEIIREEFSRDIYDRQMRSHHKAAKRAKKAGLKVWSKAVKIHAKSINDWTIIVSQAGSLAYCKWFTAGKTVYATVAPNSEVRFIDSHLLKRMQERSELTGNLISISAFNGCNYPTKLATKTAYLPEGAEPMASIGVHGLLLGHRILLKYQYWSTLISQDQMTQAQMTEALKALKDQGIEYKLERIGN